MLTKEEVAEMLRVFMGFMDTVDESETFECVTVSIFRDKLGQRTLTVHLSDEPIIDPDEGDDYEFSQN